MSSGDSSTLARLERLVEGHSREIGELRAAVRRLEEAKRNAACSHAGGAEAPAPAAPDSIIAPPVLTSQPPPAGLTLSMKDRHGLSVEAEEFLGTYRLVRKRGVEPRWQHLQFRHHWIARAPSGKWYAQEQRHLGHGRGRLQLADSSCAFPHQSEAVWRSADSNGGWYDQPTLKCRPHSKWTMLLKSLC